jgi:hypothetical protein
MNETLDRTTVDTAAGEYQLLEYFDDEGGIGNPLTEFDSEGFTFYVSDGYYDTSTLNTLSGDAGNAVQTWLDDGLDDEDIKRRFALWRAITGDKTVLVTHYVNASPGTDYRCIALVDYDPSNPEWDQASAGLSWLREFGSWASGEVYGYIVISPSGETVDSCWGFIGEESREYMLEQARSAIEYDAGQKIDAANLVGSGIVGII